MIMKVIAFGETFVIAKNALSQSLSEWHMAGFMTNRLWLVSVLNIMRHNLYFDTQWAKSHCSTLSTNINLAYLAYVAAFLNYHMFNKAHSLDLQPSWGITGHGYTRDCYYIYDEPVVVTYQWGDKNTLFNESGEKIILHKESEGYVLMEVDDKTYKINCSIYKDHIWVMSYHGFTFTVSEHLLKTPSSSTTIDTNTLMSPIPGIMVSCQVKVGDVVNKGDVLAIIEAMKMHHEIKANQDLKIVTLNYQTGQHIPMAQPLFEWEAVTA